MQQQSQGTSDLCHARFSGDLQALEEIRNDAELDALLRQNTQRGGGSRIRHDLLASAVRVDRHILPDLDQIMDDLVEHARLTTPLEFFVYAGPEINGCVCRGEDRFLVMLSSQAVERLSRQELEFVIGHELGHAIYGHLEMPVMLALNSGKHVAPRQAMQLLAWQRKAEISADRAGLICCGSLDVAATAMFRLLSGLTSTELCISADHLAQQWSDLTAEISRGHAQEAWAATHPFPTLRMKALAHYWDSKQAGDLIEQSDGSHPIDQTDHAIESLLAMMDPLAREQGNVPDPTLVPFFLWGGFYIAMANNTLDPQELRDLQTLVGREQVDSLMADGVPTPALCRERFVEALESRCKRLSALELHRVFSGLATIARADGTVDEHEIRAMRDLAAVCGISESFVETALNKAA